MQRDTRDASRLFRRGAVHRRGSREQKGKTAVYIAGVGTKNGGIRLVSITAASPFPVELRQ